MYNQYATNIKYVYIANQGFSIGISDVTPGKRLREIKDEQVAEAYKKCDEIIAKLKAGQLETMPGCDEEETMEVSYTHILDIFLFWIW